MRKQNIFLPGLLILVLFHACENKTFTSNRKALSKDNYKDFKDEVLHDSSSYSSDTANIFDLENFDPNSDSLQEYLENMEEALVMDSARIERLGVDDSGILHKELHADTTFVRTDTFTNDIKKITPEEIKALKFNLESFSQPDTLGKAAAKCKQASCKIWVRISKAKQYLFLHVDGKLVDSFKVSTGDVKHETPLFDTKPNGLMFRKYTSKKYPGGNYNGLGNMPYAVFIRGGYAIHGTTVSNFKKLGKKASHGCIRLHPDNAKLFFELVKAAGAMNTWITVSVK